MPTWLVWSFLSPDIMACSVGYLIPSSQEILSSLSAIKVLKSVSSSSSPSASSSSPSASCRSTCRLCRYRLWQSRTCHLRIVRKTSLLFVHPASFFRNRIWQCSGPYKTLQAIVTCYLMCYIICYITCNVHTIQHSLWLSLIVPSALIFSARACELNIPRTGLELLHQRWDVQLVPALQRK